MWPGAIVAPFDHLAGAASTISAVRGPISNALFLMLIAFAVACFILLVLLVLIARRERTLRGWQGEALQRLDAASQDLAAAQRCVLRGDRAAMMELVRQAKREFQEIEDLERRYPESIAESPEGINPADPH